MTLPKILLIGTGGVGTIVAYGLVYNKKSIVDVVVHSDYQHVTEHGWKIDSCDYGSIEGWKPNNIYPSVEEAGKNNVYDYVVITTKNLPDVTKPEEVAKSAITPEITAVVLIQNGFDLGRPFISKYPNNYCLSGVSYIGSHNNNGVISHVAKDKVIVSYFENPNLSKESQELKTKEFIDLYSNDKNAITYHANAKYYRYKKLVYNATLNTVCALTKLDTGRLLECGVLESLSIPAMHEVIKIAKADNVELPEDEVNTVVHCNDNMWYKPSMLVDIEKGNPIELEVILGNLLVVARELEVDTPVLNVLYSLLKATQFNLMEQKGLITVPEKRLPNDKFYK